MIAHLILYPLLLGLLNQTQILSHVTKRVVDSFGGDSERTQSGPVVVVINQMPDYPYRLSPGIDPADWLVVPPPPRFVLLADSPDETCVMGVVLDGVDGGDPAISWTRIAWNSPVSIELPGNALGAFFGVIDNSSRSLTMRRIDEFDPVQGHQVLALRDERRNLYRGELRQLA